MTDIPRALRSVAANLDFAAQHLRQNPHQPLAAQGTAEAMADSIRHIAEILQEREAHDDEQVRDLARLRRATSDAEGSLPFGPPEGPMPHGTGDWPDWDKPSPTERMEQIWSAFAIAAVVLLGALLIAVAVTGRSEAAEARYSWGQSYSSRVAWVELGPPQVAGAVATVTFQNQDVHTGTDEFTLEWEGISVDVLYQMNVDETSHDRMTFEADCCAVVPRSITVPERAEAQAHLYLLGVGS